MACTRSSSAGRSDPRKGRRRPASMASRSGRTIRLRPAAPIPGHEPHQLLPADTGCRPVPAKRPGRRSRRTVSRGAAPRSPLAVQRLPPSFVCTCPTGDQSQNNREKQFLHAFSSQMKDAINRPTAIQVLKNPTMPIREGFGISKSGWSIHDWRGAGSRPSGKVNALVSVSQG